MKELRLSTDHSGWQYKPQEFVEFVIESGQSSYVQIKVHSNKQWFSYM